MSFYKNNVTVFYTIKSVFFLSTENAYLNNHVIRGVRSINTGIRHADSLFCQCATPTLTATSRPKLWDLQF